MFVYEKFLVLIRTACAWGKTDDRFCCIMLCLLQNYTGTKYLV